MASRPALVVGPPGDGVATKQLLMPSQDVVAGLHWPSPDFGDSATWEFDPGRVYRQASRRCRNPWGLWTSPKGRPNGWSQCTAAKELGSIGDHHWEITIDVSDMLSLVCAEDVPDEYRWDVTELGVGLESWGSSTGERCKTPDTAACKSPTIDARTIRITTRCGGPGSNATAASCGTSQQYSR